MTVTPLDMLRRQIMLTVYGARPELGTDGAGEVADALLASEVGELAAKVARVEALHGHTDGGWCQHCGDISDGGHGILPCYTRRALDGATT